MTRPEDDRHMADTDFRTAGEDVGAYLRKGHDTIVRIIDNVETVIYGKREVVELVTLAAIARGHVLIEDVPGVGKTSLVSAFAKSISCDFKRIQFTPDIMPSDLSGYSVYNQKTAEFEFHPGAIISNIVLADEINRAGAKTQAATLEAMEERQVTVDARTYRLEEPFMVLATENPIESFGTSPLPEAQIDRFLVKTTMGYPSFEEEVHILKTGSKARADIKAVASKGDVIDACNAAELIRVSPAVARYIVDIVEATRTADELKTGSSPRGSIALEDLACAYALYRGRTYVKPDDIKHLVPAVLGHRVTLSHEAKTARREVSDVLRSIVDSIEVPVFA